MAKRITKLNKLDLKTEKMFRESDVCVLLEHIDTNVKLLAEGYDSLREEMHESFKNVWGKFDAVDQRFDSLEKEMRDSFKTVFEYLSKIDNELADIKARLENKADKPDLDAMEKRLSKLEFDFAECKNMIAELKKS